MKKLLLSLLFISGFAASGYAQTFSENMGNVTISTSRAISTHNSQNSWQNSGTLTFSGTADLRTSSASATTDYPSASGNVNVYFASGSTNDFIISGINTISITSPALAFGIRKDNNIGSEAGLAVEYSTDGSTYTPLSYTALPTGNSTTGWYYRIISGLPSSATLSIKFRATAAIAGTNAYRIDDVSVNSLSVLPVSLTSFTAKANLQNIDLAWATASEKDNSHFDILRSGDGKTFTKIGDVKGNGTTDIAKNYSFTDKNALPGVNYYQLKQVDNNGTSALSKVEAVKSNVAASNLKVSASKQDGTVKLTVFAANEGNATFKIYDLNGRKITERVLNLSKGYSNVSVPFNGGNGLHIASLTTATETVTQKFIQ